MVELIVYGERNSCNTYMVKMTEVHFPVRSRKDHFWPRHIKDAVHLVMVKNPYAWLLSLWRKPHGPQEFRSKYTNLTFDDFLRARWKRWPNPIIRYNEIYNAYWNFQTANSDVLVLKSEEVQRNPREALKLIARKFDLPMQMFNNITEEVESSGQLGEKFQRLDYYLNEAWRMELTRSRFDFINSQLDPLIFDRFGYICLR